MIALVVFTVCGMYLLVSILAIYGTYWKARKLGFNPWLPSIAVAAGMYLLVFWDFIPVLVKHRNLCKEQGGVWIYKTPVQWFKENPGAIGKNWGDKWNAVRYENVNDKSREWLSEYVYLESSLDKHFSHAISKYESRLIDARTGELLARMIDFRRGGGNPMLHAESLTDYKFWLGIGNNTCGVDEFGKTVQKYNQLGRVK